MAKILLISSNLYQYPYPVYPSGMSAISAALKRGGHQTFQYDMLFPKQSLEKVIEDFNPDIVGISVRNIDNEDSLSIDNHWSGDAVRSIVSTIKNAKGTPVFLGGAGFSVAGEEFLNYTKADFGIIGAGEISTAKLVNDILSGKAKNKIYRSKGITSDIRYIVPDIDADLLKKYADAGGLLGVISKRGCAYSCGYCSYPLIDGGLASFDIKTIVRYIKMLETEYGVKEIFFTDSVFNDSCGFAKALCEEMIKQKTQIKFAAYFNPAGTSFDELKLYKEAGLFAVELGTDASTDTTLKALNKPFNFKEVEDFQNMCDSLQIPCAHFIIFGGPGETMQTVREGLENI
ncbi:MAG: cobalamin-dependent protein, partial [Endomicrobia bacterium]|nr:cobalamin-dependent protein [Endomicrobiia bacterium]